MSIQEFISPAIISAAIGATGWLTKKALEVSFNLLISYIKNLLKELGETKIAIGVLDNRMSELTHTMATIPKLKADLDAYFQRMKALEEKLERHINEK